MVTYDEKVTATARMAKPDDFDEKVKYAFYYTEEAFKRLAAENNLMNKSAMAMNIAYLTLYLEAIQTRYNIPATSVDGWIDAFVRDENNKAQGVAL